MGLSDLRSVLKEEFRAFTAFFFTCGMTEGMGRACYFSGFVLAGRGMGFDFFPATFFNLLVEFLSFAYFFMAIFFSFVSSSKPVHSLFILEPKLRMGGGIFFYSLRFAQSVQLSVQNFFEGLAGHTTVILGFRLGGGLAGVFTKAPSIKASGYGSLERGHTCNGGLSLGAAD